ncbi:NADH-quinone oxidoreductase subunit L [Glycomyces buryatensis]|uniref:NADH-quinone oxidoreductase subunit L n=1 Tax=Glycomyces buryatensis TaxID=2570927 RepID=A0A4S8QPR9_9ACTN|nr:NADH-quinone oxidoreductase subunit L [Glycomyces buryatensis]THV43409.1 NADH-quinone oxidoreductase subunit L [Glycomyces buryatensis]
MGFFAWALIGLPAAAGLAGLLIRRRRAAAWSAVLAPLFALVCSIVCFFANPFVAFTLADFGSIRVSAALDLSPTASAVAIASSLVTLLVQLYSVSYLRDDSRYGPFAAQVNLFLAAMLVVVAADDLVFLLIGWEVMGACSYLLIAHYAKLPSAPGSAAKAFLVTRFGDVAFVLGVMVLGTAAGTFRISEIGDVSEGVAAAAMLLILFGCIGKSAQFPLQIWLPPAMAGPTPVSALIHAATMVAAGAYVLTRLLPVWPTDLLVVVALVAAISMLGAGLCAFAATDVKGVLAWSTVSQVGFMFAAVAVADPDAALFHLLSHAGFKALLFLTAGVIIHQAGTDGSLATTRVRPSSSRLAFWAMTLGLAAMAGIPPLGGFYSKEAILGAAYESATPAGVIVFWAGIGAGILTAAYSARLWLLVFWRGGAKERATVPLAQSIGLWTLTGVIVVVGGLYFAGPLEVPPLHLDLMVLMLIAVLGGFAVVGDSWWRDRARDPARLLGRTRAAFARGLYAEALAGKATRTGARAAAGAASALDEHLVDQILVEGSARATVAAAHRTDTGHRGGLVAYLRLSVAGTLVITACAIGVSLWMS